ncbi:hypothetical protein Taro_013215 [Colocasia esculenta]|uniref:DJ-1/PfpI domain-containing protein n=1 Tax=Colocasia esculenta TaxID=4460 RepID=A0A843UBF7_COLES|nr:hypothetical protein [Colocasia esculenta]
MGSVEAPQPAAAAPARSVLMICGDYMEDYEAAVPFYALSALAVRVHCASPGKPSGAPCPTAIHDFLGFELYTELPGHNFPINADFEALDLDAYDALIIPGGRFTEFLSDHAGALAAVSHFAAAGKPIMATCHSQMVLAAAGVIQGTRCTAFPSMKPVVELAGGVWSDPEPISSCVVDRGIISAIGWPAHAELLGRLLRLMGAVVSGPRGLAVLFLCGDFVDDYEMNVPFRALGALGCRVEAACPGKEKGQTCAAAVFDPERAAQVCSEKRGHNVVVTASWGEVRAEDYDAVVVPGGRSPELLVGNPQVVSLVSEAVEKGKVVAAIGHGQLVLAAAGLLKGKKCAGGHGMKVAARLAGGVVVESAGPVADGKLLTASGWPALAQFISDLVGLLGLGVSF